MKIKILVFEGSNWNSGRQNELSEICMNSEQYSLTEKLDERLVFGVTESLSVMKHCKGSLGTEESHISGACYQLCGEVWCLSVNDNKWVKSFRAVTGLQEGWGFQGLDRLNRWTGLAVRCEEGSSWQTTVHSQSVRGRNYEALSMSVWSFQTWQDLSGILSNKSSSTVGGGAMGANLKTDPI